MDRQGGAGLTGYGRAKRDWPLPQLKVTDGPKMGNGTEIDDGLGTGQAMQARRGHKSRSGNHWKRSRKSYCTHRR